MARIIRYIIVVDQYKNTTHVVSQKLFILLIKQLSNWQGTTTVAIFAATLCYVLTPGHQRYRSKKKIIFPL